MRCWKQWTKRLWPLALPGSAWATVAAAQSNPGIDPTLFVGAIGLGAAAGAIGGYYAARKSKKKKD